MNLSQNYGGAAAVLDEEEAAQREDGISPHNDDASGREEPTEELSFDEKLTVLGTTVMRHPLNREILYKTLAYCREERPLREAEDYIASLPQFELATQNQYYLLMSLVKAHGLEFIERDDAGHRVTAAMKEGLTEDEADDLVASWSFKTTEVGTYFVDYNQPRARLIDLFNLVPERADTYAELLEFVGEAPRSYAQIEQLLTGRPALQTIIDGRVETMQPSVFVDKLERAGALVWKEGWVLTEEGRSHLEELRSLN